jgi:hypothetical protein
VPRRIDPPAIVQLLEELKPLMASCGFRPVSEVSAWTGKFNVFSWVRQSWKEDLVRLGWRKPPVATYFLDAQWSVPRPGAGIFIAAGINAAYARRGSSDSSLPTELPVIGALAARRWCAEVLLDAESALAWCDRCSTRAGALEELARPERNGPRIGSEAYAHIEHYVRAHAVP